MISETTNQRLLQASIAWSRLFQNIKPVAQHTQLVQTATDQTNTTKNQPSQTQTQKTIIITQDNLTKNTPWGDEIQDKDTDIIRIYAQNLNGMKIQLDGCNYKEVCEMVKEVKADIFCFQEHNLDTTQFQIPKNTARHDCSTVATRSLDNSELSDCLFGTMETWWHSNSHKWTRNRASYGSWT
jgi:hypothetical protein